MNTMVVLTQAESATVLVRWAARFAQMGKSPRVQLYFFSPTWLP
jgi:hypothetical protein